MRYFEGLKQKKTGTAKFHFAFIYEDSIYGVWYDYKEGKIFVSFDYDKNSKDIYAMTLKDHRPNTMMFNALKRYNFWRNFIDNYRLGNVCYENQRIKHNVFELIKSFHNY